jgi:nucleotide-binding universal stress UspA family protein
MTPTVVCGVDHSPMAHSVVEAAAALAEGIDARLLLAHCSEPRAVPLGRATPHPGFPGWAPSDPALGEHAHLLLDRLEVHGSAVATETILLGGDPATALCDLAEAAEAELLVVGSRGLGAIGTALLGSVSAEVTRRAPCPVVVIPHAAAGDVERPLVDGSSVVCAIGTRADRRLGALAAHLASGLGLRLRIAHVLAPLPDTGLALPDAGLALPGASGVVTDPSAGPRSPEAVALLKEVLEDILAEHPELDGRADWCLRSGDAGTQLAELGASSHAAAIVVGTCGRGAMRSALTRSPAATLARAATVPVVISRDGAG